MADTVGIPNRIIPPRLTEGREVMQPWALRAATVVVIPMQPQPAEASPRSDPAAALVAGEAILRPSPQATSAAADTQAEGTAIQAVADTLTAAAIKNRTVGLRPEIRGQNFTGRLSDPHECGQCP